MLPFKNILFPVDYSGPCEAVVPYVKEMAGRSSGQIAVVHAYEVEDFEQAMSYISDPAKLQADEERRLRAFARKAFPVQHVECFVARGEPGSVIEKLIRHESMDVVMLPTHGRGPIRRMLVGSVAAKIMHDSCVPVWVNTVSGREDRAPELPYKSILCSLDDTAEAESVLRAASKLAQMYQAGLSVVHIIPAVPVGPEVNYSALEAALIAEANVRLRELKGTLGVDAPHAVLSRSGSTADVVRDQALARKADLIVTGRGRSQSSVNRLRSTLYSIVREAPCPVLSI